MAVEVFIDTNVLVYSVSSHPPEKEKREIARALIASTDFGISAQVLAEFYVTVTKKIGQPLSDEDALQLLEPLMRLPVITVDSDLVLEAIAMKRAHRISYWDGAIIAAAHRLGASTIFSEDLSDGQSYGSTKIVNPFRKRK
jgi:predicted nucleic acid-binding protein